ncbi:hypothetical protein O181_039039 [Austropuccinia psidii MF-1]|uniref:Uncharacterized protein n=1 Tax=Austropuccinia psidii MF-1 TaxID=1389203 RepID=A0A9Q3D9J0_9BASI|nr:hypothetical protein [Austropuccinia psidii MF-1]
MGPLPLMVLQGILARIRQISNSPTNPNAEGSDELDGEEVDVVCKSAGHQFCTSPSQPSDIIFQCQVIPSTPKDSQQVLSIINPPSPSISTARPALVSTVRPSPIPQPRNSLMVTTQQLQPVASSSRRREDQSPLPFPATQVFQQREHWPVLDNREDPNMANEGQNAVARFFMRVDRNSREVSMYFNDRNIPGTGSEEMAAKFSWYEDELINYLKRTFDDLGRDN